jgi:hypothetical protein
MTSLAGSDVGRKLGSPLNCNPSGSTMLSFRALPKVASRIEKKLKDLDLMFLLLVAEEFNVVLH